MAVQATAKVHVVIEIDVGSWGDDCTIAQVHAQTAEVASHRINQAREALKTSDMRIIRIEPVVSVITKEQR